MIVVTGATGNVGRTLVRQLAETGEQVTAVARRITEADVPRGVRAIPADLAQPTDPARPAGLATALEGADALFLLIAGELLTMENTASKILDQAAAAGIRRVVLLSSQGAATRPQAVSHAGLRAFEVAVRDSGLEWTILRPGGFASNTFAWAESIRAGRTVHAPFADVALPILDPDDIAEMAATVLLKPGHESQTYELTGPAPITPRQMTAALSESVGEPITFHELTRDEARAHMLTFMPEPVADGTLDIIGAPTQQEQQVSQDIAHVLGREPSPFAAWATRNAAAFR